MYAYTIDYCYVQLIILYLLQSKGGDIIDCVDIYKQPAFNSPLLKDHKIQMRPTVSAREIFGSKSNASSPPPPELQQEWQQSGSCPEGTIPILRNTRRENATAAANFAFHPFPNGSLRVEDGSPGPHVSMFYLMQQHILYIYIYILEWIKIFAYYNYYIYCASLWSMGERG